MICTTCTLIAAWGRHSTTDRFMRPDRGPKAKLLAPKISPSIFTDLIKRGGQLGLGKQASLVLSVPIPAHPKRGLMQDRTERDAKVKRIINQIEIFAYGLIAGVVVTKFLTLPF